MLLNDAFLLADFDEAIAWGERRISVLPDDYYGVLPARARSRAFTVSGLAALDQIQAVLDSLNGSLAEGETFETWKKAQSAEVLSLGRNRLDTIFRTAVQTHYNIGRYQQQELNKANRPYRMWDAINDGRTRPDHRAMDNFIAPLDDPIWQKWSAPAGFRCRCSTRTLTEAQAVARGYKPGQVPPDAEPDRGWDYDKLHGQDEALQRLIAERRSQCNAFDFAGKRKAKPVWCDGVGKAQLETLAAALDGDAPMPAPRSLSLPLLPVGRRESEYLQTFMAEFGKKADETALITDKTGLHTLAVSDLLFEDHKTGRSKIDKNGRAPWLLYVAHTITDPDEIRLVEGGHGDRSLYLLASYLIKGKLMNIITVFKEDGKVWTGWTGYQSDSATYLESKRANSVLIYRRQE